MAAAVGATVAGKVLGRTKAERAFRPWWDELEDQLIYGLLTLGKIQYSLLHHSDLDWMITFGKNFVVKYCSDL